MTDCELAGADNFKRREGNHGTVACPPPQGKTASSYHRRLRDANFVFPTAGIFVAATAGTGNLRGISEEFHPPNRLAPNARFKLPSPEHF